MAIRLLREPIMKKSGRVSDPQAAAEAQDVGVARRARSAAMPPPDGRDAAPDEAPEVAVAHWRQIVARHPGLGAAHANLGLVLLAAGKPSEAEAPLRSAVALLPADASLANAWGVALESMGRFVEAEQAYRAAIATRPDFVEARSNLASCLRRQGRLDEALEQASLAVALAPDFAVGRYNLGVVLQSLGRRRDAIAQYRLTLERRDDHVEALNNLGICLRLEGEIQAACAAFERVLALRPDLIEAHCNLCQFKTYVAGDPQVEQMLAQRHRVPALPALARARYWFSAGKMLEDTARYDEAFAAYEEGNRIKRASTPWDESAHDDLQRRIAATFVRDRFEPARRDGAGDGEAGMPVPVFIVGMPRSGTSLLEQVLATLPGVHGAGELATLGETLASAALDHPAGEFRYPETLARQPDEALRRLGRTYLASLRALAPQATHVVDKLPANFMHLGLIHLMFPNARILHATRDPLDTCFSCYARLFNGDNLGFAYDLGTLARYWDGYQRLMRHWHAVLPAGRILDVSYEAMVADLEAQARRVVGYLGLPWDARCLGFHANQRLVKTASVAQVRRPVYETSVARWTRFERHLGPLRERVDACRS
jgi:tetratricopeptide (TPR) repeat protein